MAAADRSKAYDTLATLGVANVFLLAYETEDSLPANLDIYFGPPEEFFLAPETQEPYTNGSLIPILDDGNFGTVTFFDPWHKRLVQKSVDAPSIVEASFENWQQYLADLMIRVAESLDADAEVREVAQLVQFAYLDEMLQFFAEVAHAKSEEYYLRRAAFISRLAA